MEDEVRCVLKRGRFLVHYDEWNWRIGFNYVFDPDFKPLSFQVGRYSFTYMFD